MRWLKIPVFSVMTIAIVGVLIFGAGSWSYLRTSARSVQNAVKDSVPIEFELRRARDLIEMILPQLQAQVRMIAEEEVEIANLGADLESSIARLDSERDTLVALRSKADTTLVSITVGNRELSRNQLVDQLHGRFKRFKQGELAVQSKQRLLEGRQKSLQAALTMLEKTRDRKVELEQKVEALAAENRLVKASRIESGRLVDQSQLSKADELLTQIQTRLDVAQRVLAHEQDLESALQDEAMVGEWVDEQQVLNEIDEHFQDLKNQEIDSSLSLSNNEPR